MIAFCIQNIYGCHIMLIIRALSIIVANIYIVPFFIDRLSDPETLFPVPVESYDRKEIKSVSDSPFLLFSTKIGIFVIEWSFCSSPLPFWTSHRQAQRRSRKITLQTNRYREKKSCHSCRAAARLYDGALRPSPHYPYLSLPAWAALVLLRPGRTENRSV